MQPTLGTRSTRISGVNLYLIRFKRWTNKSFSSNVYTIDQNGVCSAPVPVKGKEMKFKNQMKNKREEVKYSEASYLQHNNSFFLTFDCPFRTGRNGPIAVRGLNANSRTTL